MQQHCKIMQMVLGSPVTNGLDQLAAVSCESDKIKSSASYCCEVLYIKIWHGSIEHVYFKLNFCLLNYSVFLHKVSQTFSLHALRGSTTFINSYGFIVDLAH